jgi:hypothetical protein
MTLRGDDNRPKGSRHGIVSMKQVRSDIPGICIFILLLILLLPQSGAGGPPFKTDDPQPVDFRHWEFYLASEQEFGRHSTTATLPHFEVNFGAFQNLQLHVVAPLGYVRTGDGQAYGYSDTELGVKYRFLQESDDLPQIGVFPMVELPTGNAARQLGSGSYEVYIPVWIQKSWGNFTTYGGGGVWYTPGAGNQNWIFTGWEAQYDFSSVVTVGGELYYSTANTKDDGAGAGFDVGGYINLSENDHILVSLGHSFHGEQAVTGYLGFQYTL